MTERRTVPFTRMQYEQAAEWHVLTDADAVSPADRARMTEWLLQDPAHKAALDAVREIWADGKAAGLEDEMLGQEAREAARRPTARRAPVLAMAASLFVLIVAGLYVFLPGAPETATYATAAMEQKQFILEDGSVLQLDALSRVEVEVSDDRRWVRVQAGTVFFEVRPRADVPFDVEAANARVRVTGTTFDVELRGADARSATIAVHTGHVAVSTPGGEKSVLSGGELVAVDAAGRMSRPLAFDIPLREAWRSNRFLFDQTPLADVVDALNEYYGVRYELGDAGLAALPFSGTFDRSNEQGIRASIEATLPVSMVKPVEGRYVLVRNGQAANP